MRRILATLAFFLATLPAFGANWYVKKAAGGTNAGTSWTNAWPDFSSINFTSVACGDTIWIAGTNGGTAYATSPSGFKTCTSGNPVLMRRVLATDAVPVAAAGWVSTFDSQVVITNQQITMTGNWWTIDGRVGDARTGVPYGIKFNNSADGWLGVFGNNGSGTITGITLAFLEIIGPACVTAAPNTCTGTNWALRLDAGGSTGITVDHTWAHQFGEVIHGPTNASSNFVLTNSYIGEDTYINTVEHEDLLYTADPCGKMTFVGNTWYSSGNDGIFMDFAGCNNGFTFVNNVMLGWGGWAIEFGKTGTCGPYTIVNNTFANNSKGSDGTGNEFPYGFINDGGCTVSGSSQVTNNIFYNTTTGTSNAITTFNGGTTSNGFAFACGTGCFSYSIASPIQNFNGFVTFTAAGSPYHSAIIASDLHLSAAGQTLFKAKGTNLTSQCGTFPSFCTDKDGNARPTSGAWDLGAYQVTAATLPPTGLSGTVNYNVALSCSPSSSVGTPTFSIYKGTLSGGETLLTSGLSSCSYTDTAVSPSTTYFYKATETIGGAESAASNETSDTLPAASSCFLPNLLCAYNGVDIVQWGTIPDFGGLTNNNAVAYDTSFLGHTLFNGTTFTSGVCPGVWCNLSQVTRLTDSVSATVSATKSCAAGIGGSGEFTVVNTNTTLVGVDCNSLEYIGLFNPSGGNIGHFTPVNSGVFITTDLCQAGNLCTVGLSSQTQDFGSITFSQTDPSIVFNFGGNSFDVTSAYDGLTVFPYQINYALNTPIASAPIGAYKLLPGIVDFKFGLPQFSAIEWNNATGYSFGNYVIHTLTAGEMATSGVWATAHLYALGDIVVAQGGTAACMYRVITAGGVNTSGSSPAFVNSPPCNDNQSNLTDAAGNVWRGTNGLAQFLYQNTNTACTLGSPCTSAASFSIGGGNHPDLLSTVTEGANATKNIWVNTGPAYVPASANQEWTAVAGVSSDCSYIVSGHCFPSKYGIAISTNTYGDNLAGGGYTKYKGGQGTGVDVVLYDATTNAFQHLNTLTGIWNTYTCGTGNGFSCGSITSTTVGTSPLAEIADPFGTGQNCPFFIHNAKNNTLGTFDRVTDQQNVYSACDTGIANSSHGRIWNMNLAAYNTAVTAPGSLQAMFSGIAHDAIDTTEFLSAHGASAIPGAANGGWFTEVYQVGSAAAQPATSVYMTPGVNLPGSGLFPTGCETNGTNPDCNLADFMDQHISCVGGCDHGALHACGTTYNYATFSPVAFNAWQNMETCYSTGTLFQVGNLPSNSAGQVSQFTHTFATGTSAYFPTQFQISEWSQDGNWLFFSSDYACQLGSTTGAAPTVYLSGANHVGFLAKAYSARSPLPPTSATSLCGLPWLSGISYQVGNTINPLEVTSVAGGADDVFQAIASCSSGTCQTTSGTGGGLSGPANQPGGSNNQPACVIGGANKSCFANTNAPTASAAGDTVCDNQNFNGTGSPVTGTQLNSINPSLPYSTSCPNGIVWQDLGPANALGEVFAVQVAGFGVSLSPPILRVVGGGHRIGSGHVIP